ncbi:TrmB family transcriptional regulator [Kitasatospora kifunensis]|uniref:Sugar-specific transcriptional regulator TrmB n=1 Tax=Kitasatospora kifunensis TaxID=58351 RepID=A0A7W7R398_KITKI|nr:helix-turn-helix domain-containing protein [Kitasatospora kifunensis]MBB4924564.1 sugar-specific transcriptional regulator TrmB [Kitasatospora kifunensis]
MRPHGNGTRPEVASEHSEFISAEAKSLYLRVVAAGGSLEVGDPKLDSAKNELAGLGLLVLSQGKPEIASVTDPNRLANQLSSAWQKQALALLSQAVAVPVAMQELGHAYQSLERPFHPGGSVEHIHGLVEINQRLEALSGSVESELLTAQPGGSRRQSLLQLKGTLEDDLSRLRRGVTRRIIYHPSARYSAPTRQYVEEMTEAGAEVRTLEEPFTRLFVFDRRIAVIPFQGTTQEAAFVSDPAIVGYLLDSFERLWERASPFLGATEVPPEVISRLRGNILRMMTQGLGHRVIARNLGISERTLARHIADFREEYGSETLFQLGWRMALNSPEILYEDTDEDGAPEKDV